MVSSQAAPNIWASLYPEGIGTTLVLEDHDILSAFRRVAATRPGQPLIHYFEQSLTFGDVDAQSDALACWFTDRGIGAGDRIAIVMQNIPAFALATLAAWKVGAIPVPANPMYRANELGRILGDAEPAAVICQDGDHAEVSAALDIGGLAAVPVLVASPSEGVADHAILPPVANGVEAERLSEVIATNHGRRPADIALDPEATGLILYTSGTTGTAKGAMLSHRALAHNAQFTRKWCDVRDGDVMLGIAPFFHITGFVCHLCTAFSGAIAMAINYRFEPGIALEMIRRWRPTFVVGAITAFNALMRTPSITREDMASFRSVFSGGAPIPPPLKREIDTALGITIHSCYGMTETAAPAIFTPLGKVAPALGDSLSIGIPIPGTEIRIIGDDGEDVAPGEPGEVLMRGTQIMQGYWRKPDETAATLTDGWMHSGDVGIMDADGWVYLVDRKKDVIIASGFKVWPTEVEDVIYAFPGVREVAVVGVPDAYRGETVKAFISTAADSQVDAAAVSAHCRSNLAAYKVPREIEILDDLPKTVTGKIQRAALR